MILTEDEAKTKECPKLWPGYATLLAAENTHDISLPNCCASKCMASRWYDAEYFSPRRGYCGFASKPSKET